MRSRSLTVLAPTIGSAGLTDAPSGGASAASGSYSAALIGLNGNADATSCAPAAFSATMSPAPEASGSAGPLTVVRLFRTVLLFFGVFDDREDLAMGVMGPVRRDSGTVTAAMVRKSATGGACGNHGLIQHFAYTKAADQHVPRSRTDIPI